MDIILVPIVALGSIFIGLPWLVFHYITQWRRSGGLSIEDERLLDDLHDLARRLDERMATIERIVAADDPAWRPGLPGRGVPRDGDDLRDRDDDPRAARDRRRDY